MSKVGAYTSYLPDAVNTEEPVTGVVSISGLMGRRPVVSQATSPLAPFLRSDLIVSRESATSPRSHSLQPSNLTSERLVVPDPEGKSSCPGVVITVSEATASGTSSSSVSAIVYFYWWWGNRIHESQAPKNTNPTSWPRFAEALKDINSFHCTLACHPEFDPLDAFENDVNVIGASRSSFRLNETFA